MNVAALIAYAGLGVFCFGMFFAFCELTNRAAPTIAAVGVVMFLLGWRFAS